MKKSKKLQALKKQLIFQGSQKPHLTFQKKTPQPAAENLENSEAVLKPVSTSTYSVKKNPYIIQDLKKVLFTTTIIVLFLILVYFFRNSFWIKSFQNWLFIFLHLS